MRNLLVFSVVVFGFGAHAQSLPPWLNLGFITVPVLNDAGDTMAPDQRIRRGDRVVVRMYQGEGARFLRQANAFATLAPPRESTDQVGTESDLRFWTLTEYGRARANFEAYNFTWIAGKDISLAHLKWLLAARHRAAPHGDGIVFQEYYRAPDALLLSLNDQELQPSPPRPCSSLLTSPAYPLRAHADGLDHWPDYAVRLEFE